MTNEMKNEVNIILDLSPLPMLIEVNGKIDSANKELLKLISIDNIESIRGKAFTEFLEEEDKHLLNPLLPLKKGKKAVIERIKIKAGEKLREVKLTLSRKLYRNNDIMVYCLTPMHKTYLSHEDELEEKFRILAEASPVGIVLIREGKLIFMNPIALKLMGGTKVDDYLGKDIFDFIHKDYREQTLKRLKKLAQSETLPHIESKFVRKDGLAIDVEITSRPIMYQGKPAVVSAFQDITDRIEMEKKLKRNEELYRQMFEKNQAIKLMVDPEDGRIINANKAAGEFYGYPVDKLKQMKITDLNMLRPERIAEEMKKAKNDEKAYFEFPHRLASGEIRHVEVYSSSLLDGDKVYLYSIIHDVTERKKSDRKVQLALKDLKRSNEELEHFAHIISHDLKQPMSVLIGYLNLLKIKYEPYMNEELELIIDKMINRNYMMINMINDLLSYSKIMTHSHTFSICDCGEVLKKAMMNLEKIISSTGSEVQYTNLPQVMGNESLLISLFQNIIENGIKYAKDDEKPLIIISVKEDYKITYPRSEWVFSVKDNGIGISEKDLKKIFQIFHRLRIKKGSKGSGIGLAFCKKIIERHNGRIWVNSEVGKGSTFIFTLPKI
jgi:PAS domain S-box-containing protein